MNFSDMKYQRPDLDDLKAQIAALTDRLSKAADYKEAKEIFLEKDKLDRHISTLSNLANIRHTIDTRDTFYDEEMQFWNSAGPQLNEYDQKWTIALLQSPFRADFASEFGNVTFLNAEIELKQFSPEIIDDMTEENNLTNEYEKLLASAQIPFEGKTYTLSQLTPLKNDPDDARR